MMAHFSARNSFGQIVVTHEQLKNGSHKPLDGTDHQSVSVIAQLPVLACSHQSPGRNASLKSAKASIGVLRQAFLSALKDPNASSMSITCLFFLLVSAPKRTHVDVVLYM